MNDLIIISLDLGYHAIIDAADGPLVLPHRWKVSRKHRRDGTWGLHAYATIAGHAVSLQAFLLNPPKDMVGEHKNRDGLDCRRSNLRVATVGQNASNRPKRFCHKGLSRFKGVKPENKKWRAVLDVNSQRYTSQLCLTEEQAARAYDELARQHHGEFACLNFPGEEADPISEIRDEVYLMCFIP